MNFFLEKLAVWLIMRVFALAIMTTTIKKLMHEENNHLFSGITLFALALSSCASDMLRLEDVGEEGWTRWSAWGTSPVRVAVDTRATTARSTRDRTAATRRRTHPT